MYNTFFSDIDKVFIDRVEAIIAHKPQRGDEFLHEVFELAHDLQMYATAERANRVVTARHNELPEADKAALASIAQEVRPRLAYRIGQNSYWASRLLPADAQLAARISYLWQQQTLAFDPHRASAVRRQLIFCIHH